MYKEVNSEIYQDILGHIIQLQFKDLCEDDFCCKGIQLPVIHKVNEEQAQPNQNKFC